MTWLRLTSMKTTDELQAAAAILSKHKDAINRIKKVAATLESSYGYGNRRSPSDVATDLEDAIALELEDAQQFGSWTGHTRGAAQVINHDKSMADDYVPPTSSVWPLIDLLEHSNSPVLLRHERDVLAVAIAEASLVAGGWNGETLIGGPALILLARDMGEELNRRSKETATDISHVSGKVQVLANEWAAIPVALRDIFVNAMCDGVNAKLRKMPSVESEQALILQNAYITATEIIHAMANLGGAAVSTAPDEAPGAGKMTAVDELALMDSATRQTIVDWIRSRFNSLNSPYKNPHLVRACGLVISLLKDTEGEPSSKIQANAYEGIKEFHDAWSSLPAEWASFPIELRQSIIDGLFTWLSGLEKPRDPQIIRACQVAEDLLDAAKHLGDGIIPQVNVFTDTDRSAALKTIASRLDCLSLYEVDSSAKIRVLVADLRRIAEEMSHVAPKPVPEEQLTMDGLAAIVNNAPVNQPNTIRAPSIVKPVKDSHRVRKVGPKRGPYSRLEAIAFDLRMAADALIELNDEAQDDKNEPPFKGILAHASDLIVEDKEFTCPRCGSHFFGSSCDGDNNTVRQCHGDHGCKFTWPERQDSLHMKPTGKFTNYGGFGQTCPPSSEVASGLVDRLLASIPEQTGFRRVLCFEVIDGGIRGALGHALPGFVDVHPRQTFVADTITDSIEGIAHFREVK